MIVSPYQNQHPSPQDHSRYHCLCSVASGFLHAGYLLGSLIHPSRSQQRYKRDCEWSIAILKVRLIMNEETLKKLAELTPNQLEYLAKLVDEDTTGNQDDPLYVLLKEAYDLCEEEG